MFISYSRCGTTLCQVCQTRISEGTLQVDTEARKPQFFHLTCWRPEPARPVNLRTMLRSVRAGQLRTEVKLWVREWNRQFEVAEELVPVEFLRKAVVTVEPPLRRLLLAVAQFLTTAETETLVAYTCKAWFHVSRDEEFWKTRFTADYHPSETEAQADYRRKYIACVRASCWHCKKLPAAREVYQISPYFNRLICYRCDSLPICQIESFYSFINRCKVTKATLDGLNVPYFPYQGTLKSTYLLLYETKLLPYAEARRQLLLKTIESEYPDVLSYWEKDAIAGFDFGHFYIYGRVEFLRGNFFIALCKFCGRWGNQKNLKKSVEEFLRNRY